MQPATSGRQCGMCMTLGRQCENCENDALHAAADMDEGTGESRGDNRTRAKSPLVSSAERPGKVHRIDIMTPLAAVPTFPAIISSGEKGKGDKGTVAKGKGGGRWAKRKRGRKGGTHEARGRERGTYGVEVVGGWRWR